MCECEALATLIHTYMGSFSLAHEYVGSLSLGVIWKFIKCTELHDLDFSQGHKGAVKGLHALGPKGLKSIIYPSM